MDLEARSFSLYWEPPPLEAINGIIRKYIINITGLFTGETLIHTSYNTTLQVNGLHPYSIYQVAVSAYTIEVLHVETEEDGELLIWPHSLAIDY